MPAAASRCARRSAPIFVREKTSTGPSGRRRCSISHSSLPESSTTSARCVIDLAARLRWPTCTYFGLVRDLERLLHDLVRHRRREEQRLAFGGQRRDDAPDVGPEAHVHHAVGFVEHEQFDAGEVGVLLPHVIHQPARRGDDDVDAGLEGAFLHAHLDAAVDGRAGHRRVVRQPVNLVLDLHGEFARRREHEHAASRCGCGGVGAAGRPAAAWRRRGRSAASAASARRRRTVLPVPVSAQAIRSLPGERQRDDGALDRPRLLVAEVADALEQPRVEAAASRRAPARCRTASVRANRQLRRTS